MNAYDKLTQAIQSFAPAEGNDKALIETVAPAIEGLPWNFHDRATLWNRIINANETAEFDGDTDETFNARARRDLAALIASFVTVRRYADKLFASGLDPVAFETAFADVEDVDRFDKLADIVRSVGFASPQPFSAFASTLIELELPDTIFSHLCERFMAAKRTVDGDEAQSALADTVILALEGRIKDFDGPRFASKVHG